MRKRQRPGRQTPVHELQARAIMHIAANLSPDPLKQARALRDMTSLMESHFAEMEKRRLRKAEQAEQRRQRDDTREELLRMFRALDPPPPAQAPAATPPGPSDEAAETAQSAGGGAHPAAPLDSKHRPETRRWLTRL